MEGVSLKGDPKDAERGAKKRFGETLNARIRSEHLIPDLIINGKTLKVPKKINDILTEEFFQKIPLVWGKIGCGAKNAMEKKGMWNKYWENWILRAWQEVGYMGTMEIGVFYSKNRGAGMCSGITDIGSQWAVRFDWEYKWFHMCEFKVF